MFPTVDKRKTGINLRRIMDKRGFTVKDVQEFLGLGSVQSVYRWLNGQSMPTVDNLYALSELFQVTVDEMLCGNRTNLESDEKQAQEDCSHTYQDIICGIMAA